MCLGTYCKFFFLPCNLKSHKTVKSERHKSFQLKEMQLVLWGSWRVSLQNPGLVWRVVARSGVKRSNRTAPDRALGYKRLFVFFSTRSLLAILLQNKQEKPFPGSKVHEFGGKLAKENLKYLKIKGCNWETKKFKMGVFVSTEIVFLFLKAESVSWYFHSKTLQQTATLQFM